MPKDYTNKVTIDPKSSFDTITSYIAKWLKQRKIEGIVLFYEENIASYLCVHIAKELVGAEDVKLLVPKGRFTKQQSLEKLQEKLDIPQKNVLTVNLTESFNQVQKELVKGDILEGTNISIEPPNINYDLGYYLSRRIIYKEMEQQEYNPPVKRIPTKREEFLQRLVSHHKAKHRLRMLYCYLVAEKDYKAVFGSLSKTQKLTGLFSVYGHHQGADFLPLGNLFSTQILEIGKFLNLPKEFDTQKLHEPHHEFFDINRIDLDNILIRLEEGKSTKDIHKEMSIDLVKVQKVNYYRRVSNYSRNIPYIPPTN